MLRSPRVAVSAALVGAAMVGAAWLAASCTSTTVRRADVQERSYPAGVAQLRWRIPIHEQGLFQPRPEECATGVVVGPHLVVGSRGGAVLGVRVAADLGRPLDGAFPAI